MDLYNNTVHTLSTGKGAGHPDGLVVMQSYCRMWNNVLYQLQHPTSAFNAYLYANLYSTTPVAMNHVQIYNNLVYQTDAPREGSWGRGIDLAPQGEA